MRFWKEMLSSFFPLPNATGTGGKILKLYTRNSVFFQSFSRTLISSWLRQNAIFQLHKYKFVNSLWYI